MPAQTPPEIPPPVPFMVNPRALGLPDRPSVVTLLLTFDDGPHVPGDSSSHTLQVLKVLATNAVQPGIKAAFFVQTEVTHRMASAAGLRVVRAIHDQGHLVEIHTGSTKDHERHWKRVEEPADDLNGDEKPDGDNGLESDMLRAKQHILGAVGVSPKYVRAVGGELAAPWTIFGRHKVITVYNKVHLKHIRWDVDSHDNQQPRPEPKQVIKNLEGGVARAIADGKRDLVVLFHDINDKTASHLEVYLQVLAVAVQDQGRRVEFARSREEIDTFFSRRNDGN
jgi:peptidoglycan/xylan/chitin deacetylase (PgdA/CDA1 family)